MRTCTKCFRVKPDTEFYNACNSCKVCTCAAVKRNREQKREQYAAYERKRFNDPDRKRDIAEYQRTRRRVHSDKEKARQAIMWAVRRGWLKPQPCEVCGTTENIEAHHEDYAKPLEVRWLCFKHHREVHGQVVLAGQ